MPEQTKARILVIDNDPFFQSALENRLMQKGYSICAVKGIGQELITNARKVAKEFRPHVAIVDLRLLDDNRDNDLSGFELLESVNSARCIVLSAYLRHDISRLIKEKFPDATWIEKSEHPHVLLDAIDNAVREICSGYKGVQVNKRPECSSDRIVEALFGQESGLSVEMVDDVIIRLFPETKEINLEPLVDKPVTLGNVSRGRSVVLKIRPREKREPMVIKLAPAKNIERESNNYTRHIKDNLRGRFYTILDGKPVVFWDLGAMLYSFIDLPQQHLQNFSIFYWNHEDPVKILQPLRHFFTEVWIDLYKDSRAVKGSLFSMYDKELHLLEKIKKFPWKDNELLFIGLSIPLLENPVAWIQRHGKDEASLDIRQAITHGDLHGDNLLVDDTHAWVIDFERAGMGHVLRDFVELEVDILTRLIPNEVGLMDIFKLSVSLVNTAHFDSEVESRTLWMDHEETTKAFNVIGGLRRMAQEITHYTSFQEYLWGLLLDCIFVATLNTDDKIQQSRAILFGSVICTRFRYWGQKWPPKEWLTLLAGNTNEKNTVDPITNISTSADQAETKKSSSAQLFYMRFLGTSLFLFFGVILIILLWLAMRLLQPSWQEYVVTLIFLSILIIAAFAIVGLVSGPKALDAIVRIVEKTLGKSKE